MTDKTTTAAAQLAVQLEVLANRTEIHWPNPGDYLRGAAAELLQALSKCQRTLLVDSAATRPQSALWSEEDQPLLNALDDTLRAVVDVQYNYNSSETSRTFGELLPHDRLRRRR